ncbi:MAG TPA: hypothetical protein VHW66_00125 [Stellaceae bacterium]|nr:hypothetical protein [Stellaceae bacterium]
MREFGAAFVVLSVSYWLFVGRLSPDEIGLGVCGGGFAALWMVALSRAAEIRFRFEWKAIVILAVAVAGVPFAAARAALAILKAGCRRPRGGIIEQPFDHGRERNAADATRRAAVLLAISLAPDRFALVHEGDRLRVHRLAVSPRGGDEQWPT